MENLSSSSATPAEKSRHDAAARDSAEDLPGRFSGLDDTLTPGNSASDSFVDAWKPPEKATDSPSYIWPDSPAEDVEDNPKAKEPEYRMTEALIPIPGYENVKLTESKPLPPPKKPGNGKTGKVEQQEVKNVDRFKPIEQSEAREALNEHVASHCCYGSTPAKEMEIESVQLDTALKYTLQSYVETRTVQLKYLPYKGGRVDEPEQRTPELPWEIEIAPDINFLEHLRTVVVPYTSRIGTCHGCNSRGFTKCYRCQGRGMVRCKNCKGTGLKDKNKETQCKACKASGRKGCKLCIGHGCNGCPVCEGFRKLKFFVALNVNFETCREEAIVGEVKIPKKLLGNVKGEKLFEDIAPKVKPLTTGGIKELNHVSSKMLDKHDSSWPNKLIIHQFHEVEAVPISEIVYEWNNKKGKFWVYDSETKVYAPDYPHSCCCCCRCSIL